MKRAKQGLPTNEGLRLAKLVGEIDSGVVLAKRDRRWLVCLLSELISGEDIRRRFFKPKEGARPSDRAFWLAISVLVHPEYSPKNAKRAIGAVADKWKLLPETLRKQFARNRVHAEQFIAGIGSDTALAEVADVRLKKWDKTRRVPAQRT